MAQLVFVDEAGSGKDPLPRTSATDAPSRRDGERLSQAAEALSRGTKRVSAGAASGVQYPSDSKRSKPGHSSQQQTTSRTGYISGNRGVRSGPKSVNSARLAQTLTARKRGTSGFSGSASVTGFPGGASYLGRVGRGGASRSHIRSQATVGQHRTVVVSKRLKREQIERENEARRQATEREQRRSRETADKLAGKAVPLVPAWFLDPEGKPGSGQSEKNNGNSRVLAIVRAAAQGLNPGQRQAYNAVLSGRNVFMTGGAGVGKSYCVRAICAALRGVFDDPNGQWLSAGESTRTNRGDLALAITAATGVASLHIAGSTIHRWAGIGIGNQGRQALLLRAQRNIKTWRAVKVLVIDEISMISAELFDDLEYIARRLRGVESPFGGIQLVLVGDFYQLPPVSATGTAPVKFCFEGNAWNKCMQEDSIIELTEVFRQRDREFIEVLHELRRGKVSLRGRQMLDAARRPQLSAAQGVIPTRLHAHNAAVDNDNDSSMAKLPGVEKHWVAVDECDLDELMSIQDMDDTLASLQNTSGGSLSAVKEQMMKQLDSSCLAPSTLKLKVGAQVMLLRNLDDEKQLVNGSRGVVIAFHNTSSSAAKSAVTEDALGTLGAGVVPFVRFSNGQIVEIPAVKFETRLAGVGTASRTQIPLKLAYALTIHKTQGMTIDCATLSLARVFEAGQAYVALSRLSSLEHCCVTDWSESAIRADPRVVEFYRRHRSTQSGDGDVDLDLLFSSA